MCCPALLSTCFASVSPDELHGVEAEGKTKGKDGKGGHERQKLLLLYMNERSCKVV